MGKIRIVQISDVHFGVHHRFDPEPAADGTKVDRKGYPQCVDLIVADLQDPAKLGLHGPPDADCSVCVAVTGDLAQHAKPEEFTRAGQMLESLGKSKILGCQLSRERVFLIPGNHDLLYDLDTLPERWQSYGVLYQQFFKTPTDFANPATLNRIRTIPAGGGQPMVVVAELNSCINIQKDKPSEQRGELDHDAIGRIEAELGALQTKDPAAFRDAIRVAMIHHHPVLLPVFVEPKRGVDAVVNGSRLLEMLRDYGFQLVLHGHKHYPVVFTYDLERGWTTDDSGTTLIVAGGSAASRDLPEGKHRSNTYNLITVGWDSAAWEARVEVLTRRLVIDDSRGRRLGPDKWHWETLRRTDKVFSPPKLATALPPAPRPAVWRSVPFDAGNRDTGEARRQDEYVRLRGNMPVVEVIQSLNPEQEYEARLRIVPHGARVMPTRVTWAAGKKFPMIVCEAADNPAFEARVGYYGPMLVQARIEFAKDEPASGYVYAHMPGV